MKSILKWIAGMVLRFNWEKVLWFILYVFSKKWAEYWNAVWGCVNEVEQTMPDAQPEEKRRAAFECAKKKLGEVSASLLNTAIELAVHALKLGGV